LKPREFPRTERGRLFMLSKFASRRIRSLYHIIKNTCHQDAYYEGIIIYSQLWEAMEALSDFIKDAQALPK